MLGHHASGGGLLVRPITTIVIAIGRLGINTNEFLPATFRLLDLVFSQLLEEIHDAGHSLGVCGFVPSAAVSTFVIVWLSITSPAGAFSA